MTDFAASSTVGVQTRAMSLPTRNIIDLVMNEHRLVEQLYWEYQNTEDINVKQNKIHMIIKELSQHAAKEEMVMYPVMKRLPGGVQMVQHALTEHQEVKVELAAIDAMRLGVDAGLHERLVKCIEDVNHHVREEETELLPALAKVLSQEELIQLGDQFIAAAARAPSRPHPDAPNEGFLALAANMQAKIEDALKDTARDLTKDSGMMGIAPKASGDSAVSGRQMEALPDTSAQMTD